MKGSLHLYQITQLPITTQLHVSKYLLHLTKRVNFESKFEKVPTTPDSSASITKHFLENFKINKLDPTMFVIPPPKPVSNIAIVRMISELEIQEKLTFMLVPSISRLELQ